MIHPRLTEFVKAMSLEGLAIPPSNGEDPAAKDFSLEDKADRWIINGVSYRNGMYGVDVGKELLPGGTQEEHARRRIQAATTNEYYAPDFPLFHGIINTLYQNREGEFKDKIEAAKTALANLINGKYLMTLTRVSYNPSGGAVITHNYLQTDEYQSTVSDCVGPDGDITTAANARELLQALLGTAQSPQEIAQVYTWLRGKPTRIWRVNAKPKNVVERIARFGADSDGSGFGCDGGVDGSVASPRVRAAKFL